MTRKLLAFTLALLLATSQALAGFSLNQLQGFSGYVGAGATPANALIACTDDVSNATTYTFSAQGLGQPDWRRVLIIGVAGEDSATAFSFSSVTVGGQAAAQQTATPNTGSLTITGIFSIRYPFGTAATIAVTFSEAVTSASICVWSAYDLTNVTADANNSDFETASAAQTLDVTNNSNASFVACIALNDTQTTGARTWTGVTEETDVATAETQRSSASTTGPSGALAITSDAGGTGDDHGSCSTFD